VFIAALMKTFTDPLTAKEQETGLYNPPPSPRIAYTGTLDDSQTFYGKTSPMASCRNCPVSQWTDGNPIIPPTEEKVKAMLTGTSHSADELVVSYSKATGQWVKSSTSTKFLPLSFQVTVEKIAVNAVMAGCKPAYLPVVLGAMQNGFNYMTTNTPIGYVMFLSGPVVKEIGLNTKQSFQVGNPPGMTIGRACQLILINIGGSAQGASNTNLGNPANRTGMCFAEDSESLPPGWLGQNELATYTGTDNKTHNYDKTESFAFLGNFRSQIEANLSSQSFRNLNKGVGDLARALGVEGKPGNYNVLQYLIPVLIGQTGTPGIPGFYVTPGVAKSLYDAGLTSKAAVGKWISDSTIIPLGEVEKWGWYDFNYSGGTRALTDIDGKPVLGKDGKQLQMKDGPKDLPYRWASTSATILVGNGGGDDSIYMFGNFGGSARPIDPWR
jgi:hypothetical protein